MNIGQRTSQRISYLILSYNKLKSRSILLKGNQAGLMTLGVN